MIVAACGCFSSSFSLRPLPSSNSGRCVRSDTAMTGEVSLRGRVLPVRSF